MGKDKEKSHSFYELSFTSYQKFSFGLFVNSLNYCLLNVYY